MRRLGAALVLIAALAPAGTAHAADPLRGQQWGLSMVESDAAHSITRGTGAVVAVIDTGVLASHQDLQGRLVAGHDFVANDDDPNDENGHGTHVTGIVAANDGNGVGVSSVAPDAKVMPVRVLDADGSGSSDDIAAGIDWAVAHGAQVINLSLGPDVPVVDSAPEIGEAIDRALNRGVVVAAAAGNNGLPICEQPQVQGRMLCVGAVDRNGSRSYFSSFGQGLGIVAPGGSGLLSADDDILSTFNDGGYEDMAGTSQATPHVSGVAALLVSKGVTGSAAVDRILATARDAGAAGPDSQYGAGIVNARAAVAGLGGAGSGGGAGSKSSSFRVSVKLRQRISYVLHHGIIVRCRASGNGTCRAAATRSRTRIAAGSRRLRAGKTTTVRARLTRKGRRVLRRALSKRSRLRLRLRVTLPGAGAQVRRLTLRP
jgi:subtilisin family serine protease